MRKGETVVYGQNICQVAEILPEYRDGIDYYKLIGKFDSSLIIHAPVAIAKTQMRRIMSPEDAQELIEQMPDLEQFEGDGADMRSICEDHVLQGKHRDVLRALRAHHCKTIAGLKLNDGDRQALRVAEDSICRELSAALGIPSHDIRDAIRMKIVEVGAKA